MHRDYKLNKEIKTSINQLGTNMEITMRLDSFFLAELHTY